MESGETREVLAPERPRQVQEGCIGRSTKPRPLLEIVGDDRVNLPVHPSGWKLLDEQRPGQTRAHSTRIEEQLLLPGQWSLINGCQHHLQPGEHCLPCTAIIPGDLHLHPQKPHWVSREWDGDSIQREMGVNQLPSGSLQSQTLALGDLGHHPRPLQPVRDDVE